MPFTALEVRSSRSTFRAASAATSTSAIRAGPNCCARRGVEQAEVFVLATDDPETNMRTARMVRRMLSASEDRRACAQSPTRVPADGSEHRRCRARNAAFESGDGAPELDELGIEAKTAAERVEKFREHDAELLKIAIPRLRRRRRAGARRERSVGGSGAPVRGRPKSEASKRLGAEPDSGPARS